MREGQKIEDQNHGRLKLIKIKIRYDQNEGTRKSGKTRIREDQNWGR